MVPASPQEAVDLLDRLRSGPEWEKKTATVRKCPFGKANTLRASEKGWVYLERFCSMVKMAMVGEAEADRLVTESARARSYISSKQVQKDMDGQCATEM